MINDFKPKSGDTYWFITYQSELDKFVPDVSVWWFSPWAMKAEKKGLIFGSLEDCQAVCDKYNEAIHNIN